MSGIYFFSRPKETTSPLLRELKEALANWEVAKIGFDWANNEYIDYAVHKLNASEHRLYTLLRETKTDGLTAWPPGVDGLFTGPPEAPLGKLTKASDTRRE